MRASPRHVASGFAIAASSLLALPARGESAAGIVTWSAPLTCPQASEFQAEVERFLGQPLTARRDQSLSVAGKVLEDGTGAYSLELELSTAAGRQTRSLSHRDCRELTEAGALVTALAIDPNLAVKPASAIDFPPGIEPVTAAPAKAPPPEPLAPKSLAPSRPRSRTTDHVPPPRTTEWHPSVLALGLAGNSVLPGVGVGAGVRLAGGGRYWRLALRGSRWLERFEAVPGREGSGIALSAWSLGMRACAVPVPGRVALWGCLGPDAGGLRGEGHDLERSRTARERWASLNAELSLVYTSHSGFMTQLGFELGKTLEAPRFGVGLDGQGVEIYEANSWLALASVGFGLSFNRK